MASVTADLQVLEEKLFDLQRDTKFCVNNYDYHHKNNEYEIIQNIDELLKDSFKDARQFLDYVKTVRSSIDLARKKCLEIDDLLKNLGIKTEPSDELEKSPAGSHSFHEEQEGRKYNDNILEENKENSI